MKQNLRKFVTFAVAMAVGLGACGCLAACGGSDALTEELLESISNAETALTLDADLTLTTEETQKISLTLTLDEKNRQADLFASFGQDEEYYAIGFLRDEVIYSDYGAWPDAVAEGEFTALPALYRAADGRALTYTEADAFGGDVAAQSALSAKLMQNLPMLLGARAERSGDGYLLSCDIAAGLNDVAAGIAAAVEKISTSSTLSDILLKGYFDELLRTLFKNVTAEELLQLVSSTTLIPSKQLPEAGDKLAYDYIREVLSSKDLYDSMNDEADGILPAGKTLGTLTLAELGRASGQSEEELSAAIAKLKSTTAALKENVLGGLLSLLTGGSADGRLEAMTVSFTLDGEKKLTGMQAQLRGLEVTLPLPMASFPQATTFKLDGTFDVAFSDEVSLTPLSGMRYLSDEYQRGVLEKGETEPIERNWYMDLGRDINYQEYNYYMTIETSATVGSDSVTYHLRGEEDGINLDFTIPMEEINIQLSQDRDYIISTKLRAAHEGQSYSMTLWLQFSEYSEDYMISVTYEARLDNAPLDGSSYGYDSLPEVYLPYARVVKTIA